MESQQNRISHVSGLQEKRQAFSQAYKRYVGFLQRVTSSARNQGLGVWSSTCPWPAEARYVRRQGRDELQVSGPEAADLINLK